MAKNQGWGIGSQIKEVISAAKAKNGSKWEVKFALIFDSDELRAEDELALKSVLGS